MGNFRHSLSLQRPFGVHAKAGFGKVLRIESGGRRLQMARPHQMLLLDKKGKDKL